MTTPMKDISNMNDKDLAAFVHEKREAVRSARFNPSARDVRAVRSAKKDIARALTETSRRVRDAAAK